MVWRQKNKTGNQRWLTCCLCFAFLLCLPKAAETCSSFSLQKGELSFVAKNYDWHQSHGFVLINPRNLSKKALVLGEGILRASWTSRYGSLTFHQHGRELPLGGMNEKGLTVEVLWLANSEYPDPDQRPTLNELQWVQYQLDNFASINEVVGAANQIRIRKAFATLHYFICDATGTCGTIEFLDKEMVVHSSSDLPVAAITNSTYDDSLDYLSCFVGFGGNKPLPTNNGTRSRFVRLASFIKDFTLTSLDPVAYAYQSLKAVSTTGFTQYSIVYETTPKRVHSRTSLKNEIKSADLGRFDFSCRKPILHADMNALPDGDVTGKFQPFGIEENRRLVELGFDGLSPSIPVQGKEAIILYPNSLECTEPK